MATRLVLGCGAVGQRIVGGMGGRTDRLLVVDDDPAIIETLREESIPATARDPTDIAGLATVDEPALVVVAGDRTDRNVLATERARERFPDAWLLAYAGGNPSPDALTRLADAADAAIDPARAIADAVLDGTVSPGAENARRLRRRLAEIDGRLAVLTHDNPDPDAIASAIALVDLAGAVGVEADACYYGEITHQENRAMVNLLDIELRNLSPEDSLSAYGGFALVDHSRPGVNDQLPTELVPDVVIDHHPPRGPVAGRFVDLRELAGATSTIMTDYLRRFDVEIDRRTATALLYGIRVDTKDFTRETSALDFRAAATLLERADQDVLEQIEAPTVGGETVDTIARAIKNRARRGNVVVASAGPIRDRDALPQAAEQLLSMEGVSTTLVYGFMDEMVYLSARSRGGDLDLGGAVRDAFGPIGSAGGHNDMAGAQLEIGVLGGIEDEGHVDTIVEAAEEVIENRFFEAVESQPGTPVGAHSRESELLFAPELEDEE
ncbi:DHH family phosphoesterase [Halovivax sp.]|uniref:DHH family phosphoesterase n=1 Tax=Halovivax sp. TaxID=1935978 RepID=UPI0025BD5457|nr:DHH family phosphoesterase [Halovivax sp.]